MGKLTEDQIQQYMGYVKDHYGTAQSPEDISKYEDYVRQNSGMGALDPVDQPLSSRLGRYASNSLAALGKAAGTLRAATIGPLTGEILEKISGKPVYSGKDVGNALNPSNLDQFPSNSEMFARAGIKNPSLSDALPSLYADPNKKNPWYVPEKGGMLDPSAAGTLQTLTDPAMYVGAGEATAAQDALAGASKLKTLERGMGRMARLEAPGSVPLNPATWVSKVADVATNAKNPWVNGLSNAAVNPLSTVASGLGSRMYNSTLRPAIHEGEVYGKKDVGASFRDAGIWNSLGLESKGQDAADTLMRARQPLYNKADATVASQGGADMGQVLAPGYEQAARLGALGSPAAKGQAAALKNELDGVVNESVGVPPTPGTPATPPVMGTRQVPSVIVDEQGNPIMTSQSYVASPGSPGTPGDPGVAPKPFGAQRMSNLKTYYTNTSPKATYNELLATPESAKGLRDAAGGLKSGVEDFVENRVRGPNGESVGAGQDVGELNDAMGKFLATKRGQQRIGLNTEKGIDKMVSLTGQDGNVMGTVGGISGNMWDALKGLAIKKGTQAWRLGTMPMGYGTEGLGNSNLLDRFNTEYQEQKYRRNPWQLTK